MTKATVKAKQQLIDHIKKNLWMLVHLTSSEYVLSSFLEHFDASFIIFYRKIGPDMTYLRNEYKKSVQGSEHEPLNDAFIRVIAYYIITEEENVLTVVMKEADWSNQVAEGTWKKAQAMTQNFDVKQFEKYFGTSRAYLGNRMEDLIHDKEEKKNDTVSVISNNYSAQNQILGTKEAINCIFSELSYREKVEFINACMRVIIKQEGSQTALQLMNELPSIIAATMELQFTIDKQQDAAANKPKFLELLQQQRLEEQNKYIVKETINAFNHVASADSPSQVASIVDSPRIKTSISYSPKVTENQKDGLKLTDYYVQVPNPINVNLQTQVKEMTGLLKNKEEIIEELKQKILQQEQAIARINKVGMENIQKIEALEKRCAELIIDNEQLKEKKRLRTESEMSDEETALNHFHSKYDWVEGIILTELFQEAVQKLQVDGLTKQINKMNKDFLDQSKELKVLSDGKAEYKERIAKFTTARHENLKQIEDLKYSLSRSQMACNVELKNYKDAAFENIKLKSRITELQEQIKFYENMKDAEVGYINALEHQNEHLKITQHTLDAIIHQTQVEVVSTSIENVNMFNYKRLFQNDGKPLEISTGSPPVITKKKLAGILLQEDNSDDFPSDESNDIKFYELEKQYKMVTTDGNKQKLVVNFRDDDEANDVINDMEDFAQENRVHYLYLMGLTKRNKRQEKEYRKLGKQLDMDDTYDSKMNVQPIDEDEVKDMVPNEYSQLNEAFVGDKEECLSLSSCDEEEEAKKFDEQIEKNLRYYGNYSIDLDKLSDLKNFSSGVNGFLFNALIAWGEFNIIEDGKELRIIGDPDMNAITSAMLPAKYLFKKAYENPQANIIVGAVLLEHTKHWVLMGYNFQQNDIIVGNSFSLDSIEIAAIQKFKTQYVARVLWMKKQKKEFKDLKFPTSFPEEELILNQGVTRGMRTGMQTDKISCGIFVGFALAKIIFTQKLYFVIPILNEDIYGIRTSFVDAIFNNNCKMSFKIGQKKYKINKDKLNTPYGKMKAEVTAYNENCIVHRIRCLNPVQTTSLHFNDAVRAIHGIFKGRKSGYYTTGFIEDQLIQNLEQCSFGYDPVAICETVNRIIPDTFSVMKKKGGSTTIKCLNKDFDWKKVQLEFVKKE